MREAGALLVVAGCVAEPSAEWDVGWTPAVVDPADTGGAEDGGRLLGDEVRTLVIHVDQDDVRSLRDEGRSWVSADLEIGDRFLADVGVRLKGQGSYRDFDAKAAWRVDLDRYVEGRVVDGIDDLALNNMVSDPAMARERLAYAAFTAAGLPAPRTGHATVGVTFDHLGGEPIPKGLFTVVEQYDRKALARLFGEDAADGPLYEVEDTELTPDGIELLDHEAGDDDRSALHELALLLADRDLVLSRDAGHLIDVEHLGAYLGVAAAIAQYDAYPYSIPGDDLYLYVHPGDGLIRLLPHGADETFFDRQRDVTYLHGALGRACLADAWCRSAMFDEAWRTADRLQGELRELLDDLMAATAYEAANEPGVAPSTVANARDDLADWLETRAAALAAMPEVPPPVDVKP